MNDITLRGYQIEAGDGIHREWDEGRKRTLLVLPTGCHAVGQRLLMADGTSREVENIHVGDALMGSDGMPRLVLHRNEGHGAYYQIMPVKGDPFIVTADHKLTLIRTNEAKHPKHPYEQRGGEIIDVPVSEWLTWSKGKKHLYKLIRCAGVDSFLGNDGGPYPIDPYFLGILLGDGCLAHGVNVTTADMEVTEEIYSQAERYGLNVRVEPAGKASTYFLVGEKRPNGNSLKKDISDLGLDGHLSGEKFIPAQYKYAPIADRLQLLAGLIDADGCLSGKGYDYITKSRQLADDVLFLCRSVGLAAYVNWCWKSCPGHLGDYYRISISGDCSLIPCRVNRRKAGKREQIKNVLRTGFRVDLAGYGPYIGFTVDGDNRYLLDDFTITHNCGKTVVLSKVAEDEVNKGKRVLIMAHRDELLNQAADKLRMVTGLEASFEKAGVTSIGSPNPVTVGSVQSLTRPNRLERFPMDYYDIVIVDEAHHALSDTYQRVLEHFPGAYVLGVTATPDRGDKQKLSKYFDSIAYEYELRRAIREGYLVSVMAQMIPLELDISDVAINNGDYSARDVGNALDPYLEQIVQEMSHYCEGRKTVVFLPLVATSQKFCRMLNEAGISACEINGNSPDREELLADFTNGKYRVLCNSMLLTEGWDCPSVDCIVVLRPTRSRSLYQQMVGRGMRLSPGKENLLLLDFLWLSEKHSLCRPSSLVSKNEQIAMKLNQRLAHDDGVYDLLAAEEAAERDVLAEREQALADELAQQKKRKARLVDPLQFILSIEDEDLAGYCPTFAWELGPASEKQLNYLANLGIEPESVQNMGMASMLIERLVQRHYAGLATPKQIRLLERQGFQHVGTWPKEAASSMISQLMRNNWRLPYGVNAYTYCPA